MSATRRAAFLAGVFFIATFVSSIAGLILYGPVLNDPDYVISAGADTRVFLGAVCEVILVITNIGTALVLFPILRRQNESLALGYVAARIVECCFIIVGILSLLTVVTLRQAVADGAVSDEASVLIAARSLVALYDWTFLLGPGFVVGLGNGLVLGYLMYRSALVPQAMTWFGLIGGPLLCVSGIAVMFGLYEQISPWSFAATVPEIIWEAFLGIWLTFKGFQPSPILSSESDFVPSPAQR